MANKMYLYAVTYADEYGQITEWLGDDGEALHRAQETGGTSTMHAVEFTKAGILRLLNGYAGGDS